MAHPILHFATSVMANCTLSANTKGANPYGIQDLVGSIWQLTNDHYQSDTYDYIIMKGGSYYKPGGSWWYVQGAKAIAIPANAVARVARF